MYLGVINFVIQIFRVMMDDLEAADVIALANRVLGDSGLSRRITRIKQCNSVLLSSLYQALSGNKVPGTSTSEHMRCQVVIDALSQLLPDDVTLEHICGADIAQGDLVSIRNLLDVFGILLQSSTEAEDNDDSNLLSSEGARVVDEVLQEELAHTCSSDSTADLLQRVPSANLPPTASRLLQRLRQSTPLSVSTCSSPSPSPPSTPCSHRIQTGPLHQSTPHEGPRSRLPPPPVTNIHSESTDTAVLSISTLSPRSAPSSPLHTTNNRQTHSLSTNALFTSDTSNNRVGPDRAQPPLTAAQSASSPMVLLASATSTGSLCDQQSTLVTEEQDSTKTEDFQDNTEGPREELLQQLVQKYMSKKSKVQKGEEKVKKTRPSSQKPMHVPSGNTAQDKPTYRLTTNLLPLMEETFPKVDLSSAMERKLWHMQMKQMTALTSTLRRPPTSSCQAKTQEVQQRQAALMNIIRKDLAHTRRLQALNDQKMKDRAVQISEENNKLSVARSRRYFNDYELSLRSKLQKMRTREEQVVKNTFQQCLALQKERVREMRCRAKEKQDALVQEHSDRLESMEKFYQDQLQMMSEKVSREKEETAIREKVQRETSQRLQREIRKKMESDVERLHDEMRSWEEDCAHFRELDSKMLLTKIQRGLLKI